jgi:2-keto-3-deoxy-L-rhamnonate aldolase RhmA
MKSLRKMLREGQVVVGATMTEYARPSLAKLYSQAGFDFVFIEYEHSLFSPSDLADFILCGRDNDLPTVAKTPDLERHSVAKLLDAGCAGVQLPRTNTRADVDTLMRYMKFPPLGDRAGAPGYGNTDYVAVDAVRFLAEANEQTLVVAHIETQEGVDNIEEIAANAQVDVVLIGPYDLSISLGVPGQMLHPKMTEAMERVYAAARANGHAPGYACMGLEDASFWLKRGVCFFELPSELEMIREAATAMASQFRQIAAS